MTPHGNTGTESIEADSRREAPGQAQRGPRVQGAWAQYHPGRSLKEAVLQPAGPPSLGARAAFEKVATSEGLIGKVLRSLSRRPADEAEIRQWHALNPDCNFSAACGSPSGGLVVLDLDSADPEGCEMPPTPRVMTRRGSHIHLKTDRPSEAAICIGMARRSGTS